MSQLFGTREDNRIAIRVDNITANNVLQKNLLTGIYERVAGGSHTTLPYYLKATDIELNNETTGNGTVLNDYSLIIGNNLGNETLNKDKIKILSQLKTNIVDVDIGNYQSPFPVAYNKTTSNFERLSRLNIGIPDQYCSVSQTQLIAVNGTNMVQITPTGINIKSSTIGEHFLDATAFKALKQIIDNVLTPSIGSTYTGKFLVSYNKPTNAFERATSFSLGTSTIYTYLDNLYLRVANGSSYTTVNSQGITIKDNTLFADLTYADIKTVNGLFNPPLITPTTANKMIVFDPITKIYNTANIPSGTSFPYLLTNSIEMGSGQSLKSSGSALKNISLINGTIVANADSKPEETIDYYKLKNIPSRVTYYLTSPATNWPKTPWSSINNITREINPFTQKVPTFNFNHIGDSIYVDLTNYTDNFPSADRTGLVFCCPYLDKVTNPKFEFEHLSSTGASATFVDQTVVTLLNSGRSKKAYYFGVNSVANFIGSLRITLIESTTYSNDDVPTYIFNSNTV